MKGVKKSEHSDLSKAQARVLLSIKKNLTYINVENLEADWPECAGEKRDWERPLRELIQSGQIEAFEETIAGGKVTLTSVHEPNFTKQLVFRLSPVGKRQLSKAKEIAEGKPKPTLVHNVRDGSWKVIQ